MPPIIKLSSLNESTKEKEKKATETQKQTTEEADCAS